MPVFLLNDDIETFPSVRMAEPDGLLAVGGDLSVNRLLNAYRCGIFPWYSEDSPILWWFTHPRFVLFPDRLHVPKSLKKILTSGRFTFTVNTQFERVIEGCATSFRPDQEGSWLVPEMLEAYITLHRAGWAHSVEAWQDGELAGGLYGVALGRAFFGESMFFYRPDASKAAFAWFASSLHSLGFEFIDCQQETAHLKRFGAELVEGEFFTGMIDVALRDGLRPDIKALRFFGLKE